jgi:hypothetical protein
MVFASSRVRITLLIMDNGGAKGNKPKGIKGNVKREF